MQTFGSFLVSWLVSGTTALPTSNADTLSVKVAGNPDFVPNGPLALAKAYLKYDTPMPKELTDVLDKLNINLKRGETGTVTNFPQPDQYDREYLAEVDIGTPPQKLYLDFDTSSSDLWVFSTETPSNEVKGQTLWNPSKSSSAKKLQGYTWKISYADKSGSSGDVYQDVVSIGGLTVKNQAVESAQQVSAQFTNSPPKSSGLLGLGFDNINRVKPQSQKTWFSNIKSSLRAPLFTSYLKAGAEGTYNFGYIDSNQYTGNITYTTADGSRGYWGFTSTGYQVGSSGFQSESINGIADTGTSLLLLPNDVVQAYWSQVNGAYYDQNAPGYIFTCGTSLPDFSFGVENTAITVPGQYMSYGYADPDANTCYGGIQSDNGGLTIFGDVGLKASFVVYDAGNMQLGWAQGK